MDKRAERVKLFRDTVQFKKTHRTPLFGNIWNYRIYDAGYTLKEALMDYDILEKCARECIERYQLDFYMDLGSRNTLRVGEALGNYFHRVDENDNLYVDDHYCLEPDEFEMLATDPVKLAWTRMLPRVVPDLTIGQLQNAVKELGDYYQFAGKLIQIAESYDVPAGLGAMYLCPMETMMNTYRGIKNLSMDLRRNKAGLFVAMDAMHERDFAAFKAGLAASDSDRQVFDSVSVCIGHSILSKKQFGEFYWRYFEPVFDEVVSQGKTMFIFFEATMAQFAEYFADIPKGHLVIHLEQDDIFEVRKALPNVALAGGMPSSMLAEGTVEECVAYAKKLVDEMGEGYIFSADKMLSYKNDAKRENMVAVSDFVRNYTR